MTKLSIIIVITGMFLLSQLNAATFTGKCVKVVDADIIQVSLHKKALTVRFDCIDCPEFEQPFGKEALELTTSLVFKKEVTVEISSYEDDGTMVGRVYVNDKDVSMELITSGLAWYYKELNRDKKIAKAQKKAKKLKKGLWSQPNSIPPWIFRKTKEQNKG